MNISEHDSSFVSNDSNIIEYIKNNGVDIFFIRTYNISHPRLYICKFSYFEEFILTKEFNKWRINVYNICDFCITFDRYYALKYILENHEKDLRELINDRSKFSFIIIPNTIIEYRDSFLRKLIHKLEVYDLNIHNMNIKYYLIDKILKFDESRLYFNNENGICSSEKYIDNLLYILCNYVYIELTICKYMKDNDIIVLFHSIVNSIISFYKDPEKKFCSNILSSSGYYKYDNMIIIVKWIIDYIGYYKSLKILNENKENYLISDNKFYIDELLLYINEKIKIHSSNILSLIVLINDDYYRIKN